MCFWIADNGVRFLKVKLQFYRELNRKPETFLATNHANAQTQKHLAKISN